MPDMKSGIDAALAKFGLPNFRSGQREVIEAVLDGKDVLCVMPTGGGKSLCYQLPALLLEGVTLVVSPLIALMKDQEDHLQSLGIRVTALHGNLSLAEQNDRLQRIGAGEYSLVYVAPERFRNRRFCALLPPGKVSLLAVDEAHCISEWGHDFRPDYTRLGWFRHQMGMPPTIALTATATDVVRRDICEQLDLRQPAVFVRGFDRPNLHYTVTPASSKAQKQIRLKEILDDTQGSVIVYASSRKNCEEVAAFIRERTRRQVVIYHAGLMPDERKRAQETFMSGQAEVVVATNAFGMGIDKPDIRAVIHYNTPGTLEAYYQEAGRAGRDGKPARCELLFSTADRIIHEYFIDNDYPARKTVYKILDFLRAIPDDPIEMTREEMRIRLGDNELNEMAIGSCLKVLEASGVLERLQSRQNMAILRLHEMGTNLAELLPSSASAQRKVLRFVEAFVGERRGADCFFLPEGFARTLEMDRSAIVKAFQDLSVKFNLEYIPSFRGSATRLLDRETPMDKLAIDFGQLETRKQAEHEKLDLIFAFAQATGCRRQHILRHFGEDSPPCNNCDRCGAPATLERGGKRPGMQSAVPELDLNDPMVVSLFRTVLDALAELKGRFGKNLVAQALTGSSAKQVTRNGLNKRQCFNALVGFQQIEVTELVQICLNVGMAQQLGEPMRPTVGITDIGVGVARGEIPLPRNIKFSASLQAKLAMMVGASNKAKRNEKSAPTSVSVLPNAAPPVMQSTTTSTKGGAYQREVDFDAPPPRSDREARPRMPDSSAPPSGGPSRSQPPSGRDANANTKSPATDQDNRARVPGPSLGAVWSDVPYPPTVPTEPPEPEIVPTFEPPTQSLLWDDEPEPLPLPDYHWTARVLQAKFTVGECLTIRRISLQEFVQHALAAVDAGYTFPWEPFVNYPFPSSQKRSVDRLLRSLRG